jgi:hypothetical protein
MPFKDFLLEARLDEAAAQFSVTLFEAINSRVAKVVAAFNNRADDDASNAGVDIGALADMITALRIVTTRDLRMGITADDVGGWDPNSAKDMYDVFSKVPDSPMTKMPADLAKFFKEVSGLAPKIRKEELDDLNVMLDKDENVRKKAVAKLKLFNSKLDQLYNKLKTTVKA